MILSDRTIKEHLEAGTIAIDPIDDTAVQPSSVDVRLDHRFLVFRNHTRGLIDVPAVVWVISMTAFWLFATTVAVEFKKAG